MALEDTRIRPSKRRLEATIQALKKKRLLDEDMERIEKAANKRLGSANQGRSIGGLLGAAAAAAIVVGTGGLALAAAPWIMAGSVGAGTAIGGAAGTALSSKGRKNRALSIGAQTYEGMDAKAETDKIVEDYRTSKVLTDAWRNANIAFSATSLGQGAGLFKKTPVSPGSGPIAPGRVANPGPWAPDAPVSVTGGEAYQTQMNIGKNLKNIDWKNLGKTGVKETGRMGGASIQSAYQKWKVGNPSGTMTDFMAQWNNPNNPLKNI